MRKEIALYQVDAFTTMLFRGNPAAVCPLEEWLSAPVMQAIAAENNLSETAFFVNKGDQYELRWFTPEREIDLCGHATLAAAHVLFTHLGVTAPSIAFNTQSGILTVERKADILQMRFPVRPGKRRPSMPKLDEALGISGGELYQARDYMVVLGSEAAVRAVRPNFNLLESLTTEGIIITAPGLQTDFVSRFFAPGCGVPEDPVTGSAHCTLVPYWAERLQKQSLTAQQVSKRGGRLQCELQGDSVLIGGTAVTYMVGWIYLPVR